MSDRSIKVTCDPSDANKNASRPRPAVESIMVGDWPPFIPTAFGRCCPRPPPKRNLWFTAPCRKSHFKTVCLPILLPLSKFVAGSAHILVCTAQKYHHLPTTRRGRCIGERLGGQRQIYKAAIELPIWVTVLAKFLTLFFFGRHLCQWRKFDCVNSRQLEGCRSG